MLTGAKLGDIWAGGGPSRSGCSCTGSGRSPPRLSLFKCSNAAALAEAIGQVTLANRGRDARAHRQDSGDGRRRGRGRRADTRDGDSCRPRRRGRARVSSRHRRARSRAGAEVGARASTRIAQRDGKRLVLFIDERKSSSIAAATAIRTAHEVHARDAARIAAGTALLAGRLEQMMRELFTNRHVRSTASVDSGADASLARQRGDVLRGGVALVRGGRRAGRLQNLGQSLGTALIGAVLLTGLTTGFHERVLADAAIQPSLQQQIVSRHRGGPADGLPGAVQGNGRAGGSASP